MLVAYLPLTALKFKPSSSAGSSVLLGTLKGTSGLTISVVHMEGDGVYFLASLEGHSSTALCQPLSAELMCFSNPMDSAFFIFHCVCHPPHVSWYKPGMFHTETARCLV